MDIYEIVLKGFDGATDETDHLIKWIATSCGQPFIYVLEEIWGKDQINSVNAMPEFSIDVAGIDLIITASSIFGLHEKSNGQKKEKAHEQSN